MIVRSNDADIFYEVQGDGAPVVLLHPFPANHQLWAPVLEQLSSRYRLITPDLRGHAASGIGDGPATMEKHAEDLRRILDDQRIGQAVFVGVSIGGYILFEFWRRHRERVTALVLADTRAGVDSDEARKGRLQSAEQVLERGPEQFIDAQIPKLLGETTRTNRPDLVAAARRMMLRTTAQGIAAIQRGMASRQDSIPTLATIDVPTFFIGGEEDVACPPSEIESMHRGVRGSQIRIIPRAGHYSPFERPDEFAGILREFLGTVQHKG